MSRCYDITGTLDSSTGGVDLGTLDIACTCADTDRFLVRHGGASHVVTPLATEALVSDWIESSQPGRNRGVDAVACALGTVVDGWLLAELDELVLAAPTRQLDHLRWWRLLDAAFPARTAAVFHGVGDEAGPMANPQPAIGIGTYQNLLATMQRVLCVGEQARRELATLAGRPEEDFGVVGVPSERARDDQGSDPGIVAAIDALFAAEATDEVITP